MCLGVRVAAKSSLGPDFFNLPKYFREGLFRKDICVDITIELSKNVATDNGLVSLNGAPNAYGNSMEVFSATKSIRDALKAIVTLETICLGYFHTA